MQQLNFSLLFLSIHYPSSCCRTQRAISFLYGSIFYVIYIFVAFDIVIVGMMAWLLLSTNRHTTVVHHQMCIIQAEKPTTKRQMINVNTSFFHFYIHTLIHTHNTEYTGYTTSCKRKKKKKLLLLFQIMWMSSLILLHFSIQQTTTE